MMSQGYAIAAKRDLKLGQRLRQHTLSGLELKKPVSIPCAITPERPPACASAIVKVDWVVITGRTCKQGQLRTRDRCLDPIPEWNRQSL
jgi:hypothetical protein